MVVDKKATETTGRHVGHCLEIWAVLYWVGGWLWNHNDYVVLKVSLSAVAVVVLLLVVVVEGLPPPRHSWKFPRTPPRFLSITF